MSRIRIKREDLRRTIEAGNAHSRYTDEIQASEKGRQSERLRLKAQKLSEQGSQEEAHAIFTQAMSLFDTSDLSPAAASCYYDLAESYGRRTIGVRMENLLESERLHRRALSSPARQQDPIRKAQSLDAIGRVLRALHREEGDEEGTHLDEALRIVVEALQIVTEMGPLGWMPSAEYYNTLANTLKNKGDLDDAVTAYQEGLEYLRALREHPDIGNPFLKGRYPEGMTLVNLAFALRMRGGHGDTAQAIRLLEEVCRGTDPMKANEAWLHLAQFHAQPPIEDTSKTKSLLLHVDFFKLTPDLQQTYVELARNSGDTRTALSVTAAGIDRAMKARQVALANHIADHAAAEAQRFALLEARIHADGGDAIRAFLSLENTSGLRYHDMISPMQWRPRDPILRELIGLRGGFSTLAVMLDDMAARIAAFATEEQRSYLKNFAQEVDTRTEAAINRRTDQTSLAHHDSWYDTQADARCSIDRAIAHPSPDAALRQEAIRWRDRGMAVEHAITQRDPDINRDRTPWSWAMKPDALEQLLAEESGSVFLHIHLSDELLVAGVWLENGRLTGRVFRRTLPDECQRTLHRVLTNAAAGSSPLPGDLDPLLSHLDLTDALPESTHCQVVILPSMLASLVPWPAVATHGGILLDQFDAITSLPNLIPRWMRQAASPPRAGTLTVVPGELPANAPTWFHGIAFADPFSDETLLEGSEATLDATIDGAAGADIICIYAHGRHGGAGGGTIQLADDDLVPFTLGAEWYGCERVELWACQTGVNVSTDWLTPYVDEAFGIDIGFHHQGVRSTIGTLWSVPDFVTAHLVRHYRQGLSEGRNAPQALADAQRWWREEAPRQLPALLRSGALGSEPMSLGGLPFTLEDRTQLLTSLGPVNSEMTEEDVDRTVRALTDPSAWAGYRFVGVCERRPLEPWTTEHERGLTPEERAEVDRIVAGDVEPKRDIDEVFEEWLAEARAMRDRDYPTPTQAIRAARLYGDRRFSSHTHNLLRGLAWLHEALLGPDLSPDDSVRLRLEAAHLWIELARGELPEERLRPLVPADPVLVARAHALVGEGGGPEAKVIQQWLEILEYRGDPKGREKRTRKRWPRTWSAVQEIPAETYEGQRARWLCASVLLGLSEPPEEWVREVVEEASKEKATPWDRAYVASRFRSVAAVLAGRIKRWDFLPPEAAFVSHREVAMLLEWTAQRTEDGEPPEALILNRALCHHVGILEGDHWGYPSDVRSPFWASTGSPGLAWYHAIGRYLHGKTAQLHKDEDAVHIIASVHMGADLRVAIQNTLARLRNSPGAEHLPDLRRADLLRSTLLHLLDDAARVPEITDGVIHHRPLPRDPFREDANRLNLGGSENPLCLTSWMISEILNGWKQPAQARTAAWLADRRVENLEEAIGTMWRGFRTAMNLVSESGRLEASRTDEMEQMLSPANDLAAVEQELRAIGPGVALLGVLRAPTGALILACIQRQEDTLTQRVECTQESVGFECLHHLERLLAPDRTDFTEKVGCGLHRSDHLTALVQILDAPLGRVLADTRGGMLAILAPAPLRSMPWAGLKAAGEPLVQKFTAVASLPSVGFHRTMTLLGDRSHRPFTMCTLGEDRERGETRFGEAVIQGLRRTFPVDAIAEPEGPITENIIVEAERLEAHEREVGILRMYGSGSPSINFSTAGLRLKGGRMLSLRNLLNIVLPRCRHVEIWAATSNGAEARQVLLGDEDAIPALAHAFLTAGAAGVLDLAWPVHDLVRALVCERFGILVQSSPIPGAIALNRTRNEVAEILRAWQAQAGSFRSILDALSWLDDSRRAQAKAVRVDPYHFRLFKDLHGIPCVGTDPHALIETCCDPVQLAAFRWWGI